VTARQAPFQCGGQERFAEARFRRRLRPGDGRNGDAQPHAAAGQTQLKLAFPPLEPAFHDADRHPQGAGGLLVRLLFQKMQDEGLAVLLREVVQLLIENLLVEGGLDLFERSGTLHFRLLEFIAARHAVPADEGLLRQPQGHAVQPACDRLPTPELRRVAGQDEERRLEHVLGGVPVSQHSQGDGVHQRPEPADEFRERLLVPPPHEPFDEFGIGRPRNRRSRNRRSRNRRSRSRRPGSPVNRLVRR
jgi:hypothetical protein